MRSIAQFLGLPSASKLLIIHADDWGMCRSVNRATISALEAGTITSASIMAPCPAFTEASEWAIQHPQYDIGIHSTLISEWETYRWGPVSRMCHSQGLVDENGHFWSGNRLLHAAAEEIAEEISAQIVLARDVGMDPTHLDSHMLSVARPEYIRSYVKTARKFGLPCLIDEYWHSCASSKTDGNETDIVVDNLFQAGAQLSVDSLEAYYLSVLCELKPGLNQLIVHPGLDDDELRSITGQRQAYGAAWRQRDFEIIMGKRFNFLIKENGIQLVNWRMLKAANLERRNLFAAGNQHPV